MAALERRFLKALEPLVACYYMTPPDAVEEFAREGLDDPMSVYVTGRAAPLGRVTPATVAAVFFNFAPQVIQNALRFDVVAPDTALAARSRGVRRLLGRLLEDAPQDIAAAAQTLRIAATAGPPEGRPLYAANLALPWPDDPLESLWRAADLMREFRGDGHIAVLVSAGVSAVDALALNLAYTGWKRDFYYLVRGWPQDAYDAADERLRARGFLADDGTLTDAGLKFREMLEVETDRASAPALQALGAERAVELLAVLESLGQMVIERRGISRSVSKIGGATG